MSPTARVYVPATLPTVAALLHGGLLEASGAFAVTPRLRAILALPEAGDGVEEELAEAALVAAADASLDLLALDPAAPRRRVVVVTDAASNAGPGDVPTGGPTDDEHPAAVAPPPGLALADVVCLMLDDLDAVPAVQAVLAAGAGTPERYEAALDDLDAHALSWFDVSELPGIVAPTPENRQEGGPGVH